ncbi:MAG: maleate cis-trans isomerase family protein [Rhizobiaceae bacterium]
MTTFPYQLDDEEPKTFGLIVLQADERIESDFRRLMPDGVRLFASRVPSALEVSSSTLAEMESHLAAAAGLLPRGPKFDVVGYGCTSGTAEIGAPTIARRVREGVDTGAVTEPVSALVAACRALSITRLGFISPYVEPVSDKLRGVLEDHGVASPEFGSFAEPVEEKVARILETSTLEAAWQLAQKGGIDAMFLSCTNLRTLNIIEPLERELEIPVLSSNQVLAWHMLGLAGIASSDRAPGRIFSTVPEA